MNRIARAREIIEIEQEGLGRLRDSLGPEFSKAIDLILRSVQAGGKVVATGLGKSLHIAQKIAATLTSTGTPASTLHPSDAMHGDLGMLRDDDILLALSFSGESEELLTLLPHVKRRGMRIIAMTGQPDSALGRFSDVILPVPIEREACPFNMAPTTSTTVMLALGDALAIVLLEARGFQKEDYAKLHPGGAIGRTLLVRVSDIMRTGERLARVVKGATVKDAVLAMTSARSGAVAIVDSSNRILGIFTDGDLRRHITGGVNLAELPVDQIMTPNPISVSQDHLAVDVLRLYETHNIDDLLVVDAGNQLVGMVDIQDLPKLKII